MHAHGFQWGKTSGGWSLQTHRSVQLLAAGGGGLADRRHSATQLHIQYIEDIPMTHAFIIGSCGPLKYKHYFGLGGKKIVLLDVYPSNNQK